MKKILLLTLVIIFILIILDYISIKTSTEKDIKFLKIEKNDTQQKDIINTKNSKTENIIKPWYKIITDGKFLIIKDSIKLKDKIIFFGQNEKVNKNIVIIETNLDGNILSEKELKISSTTTIKKVIYIDNNFYVIGTQEYKPTIFIVNNEEKIIKSKTYENNGELETILKDNFDNIYIGGYIVENGKKTGYFAEIDKNLEKLNDFKINWYNDEIITDIKTDKDYIYLLGNTNSTANNNFDTYIIKLNKLNYSDYSILKIGKENLNEFGYSLLIDNNNLYIAGYSSTIDKFPWKTMIIKIDKSLKIIWRNDYLLKRSSIAYNANFYNNNIIVSGYSLEKNDDFDGFIALIEKNNGILLDEKYYGNSYDERLLNTKVIDNNAIISVGYQKKDSIISGVLLYTNINSDIQGFTK